MFCCMNCLRHVLLLQDVYDIVLFDLFMCFFTICLRFVRDVYDLLRDVYDMFTIVYELLRCFCDFVYDLFTVVYELLRLSCFCCFC